VWPVQAAEPPDGTLVYRWELGRMGLKDAIARLPAYADFSCITRKAACKQQSELRKINYCSKRSSSEQ
jgi:hypothetical protein